MVTRRIDGALVDLCIVCCPCAVLSCSCCLVFFFLALVLMCHGNFVYLCFFFSLGCSCPVMLVCFYCLACFIISCLVVLIHPVSIIYLVMPLFYPPVLLYFLSHLAVLFFSARLFLLLSSHAVFIPSCLQCLNSLMSLVLIFCLVPLTDWPNHRLGRPSSAQTLSV